MADVAHLYSPVRRTPGRKSMGAGGLTACPWLENDESARLGVRRSSRHFHLLQVLAFGYFSPHHKPIGHEGALRVPWRDSQRPVSYPVGLQRTPVTRWVVGRLHRVTRNRLSPLCSYSSAEMGTPGASAPAGGRLGDGCGPWERPGESPIHGFVLRPMKPQETKTMPEEQFC